MKKLQNYSLVLLFMTSQASFLQGMFVTRTGNRYSQAGRNIPRVRPASTSSRTVLADEGMVPVVTSTVEISPTLQQPWWKRLFFTPKPNPAYAQRLAEMQWEKNSQKYQAEIAAELINQNRLIEEKRAALEHKLQLIEKIEEAEPFERFWVNAEIEAKLINSPAAIKREENARNLTAKPRQEAEKARRELGLSYSQAPARQRLFTVVHGLDLPQENNLYRGNMPEYAKEIKAAEMIRERENELEDLREKLEWELTFLNPQWPQLHQRTDE